MKYTFKCPACGHVMEVEAENDQEAEDKLMAAGPEHTQQVHPDSPPMSDDQTREMVKGGMQKEE